MPWLSLPTGLLPVVLLLGGMLVLDSYKLVTTKLVLRSVGFGGAAAVAAWGLNRLAIDLAASTTRPRSDARGSCSGSRAVWAPRSCTASRPGSGRSSRAS